MDFFKHDPNKAQKLRPHPFALGLTTGSIGSALANPTDLVKIRFQREAGRVVDGKYVSGLHSGQAPTYGGLGIGPASTFRAFRTVYSEVI